MLFSVLFPNVWVLMGSAGSQGCHYCHASINALIQSHLSSAGIPARLEPLYHVAHTTTTTTVQLNYNACIQYMHAALLQGKDYHHHRHHTASYNIM